MLTDKIYGSPKDYEHIYAQLKKVKEDKVSLENKVNSNETKAASLDRAIPNSGVKTSTLDTFKFTDVEKIENKDKNASLDLKKKVYSEIKEQLVQLSLIEAIRYHLEKVLEVSKEKVEEAVPKDEKWESEEVAKRISEFAQINKSDEKDIKKDIVDGFKLAIKGWGDKPENKEQRKEAIDNINKKVNKTLDKALDMVSEKTEKNIEQK